jgi:hypothetical protein
VFFLEKTGRFSCAPGLNYKSIMDHWILVAGPDRSNMCILECNLLPCDLGITDQKQKRINKTSCDYEPSKYLANRCLIFLHFLSKKRTLTRFDAGRRSSPAPPPPPPLTPLPQFTCCKSSPCAGSRSALHFIVICFPSPFCPARFARAASDSVLAN